MYGILFCEGDVRRASIYICFNEFSYVTVYHWNIVLLLVVPGESVEWRWCQYARVGLQSVWALLTCPGLFENENIPTDGPGNSVLDLYCNPCGIYTSHLLWRSRRMESTLPKSWILHIFKFWTDFSSPTLWFRILGGSTWKKTSFLQVSLVFVGDNFSYNWVKCSVDPFNLSRQLWTRSHPVPITFDWWEPIFNT